MRACVCVLVYTCSHYVKIKIMDMLMFHDFEYNFELYESLKSMQVRTHR